MVSWQFAGVLPNLSLDQAVEHEYVALVPCSDERLGTIDQKPLVSRLIDNFSDQFGRKVRPSVLLLRTDAPAAHRFDAKIAFRNAVAANVISFGWQYRIRKGNTLNPLWSDYFQIYPIHPGPSGMFKVQSPAVTGFDFSDEFKGQTSPLIGSPGDLDTRRDSHLHKLLMKAWSGAFVQGRAHQWRYRCLFRSLQIVQQATCIPVENLSSLFDFGSRLSLWVSSFEVLSHPYRQNANLQTVLDLLSNAAYESAALRGKRYTVTNRKPPIKVTLAQKLYSEMYQARNHFLHGNHVPKRGLFGGVGKNGNYPLFAYAPLLYRVALITYLRQMFRSRHFDAPLAHASIEDDFDNALLTAKQRTVSMP
jgi:hypothetical protein